MNENAECVYKVAYLLPIINSLLALCKQKGVVLVQN